MKAIRTIGFTGTIASGKSSRCKRLVEVAKEHQRVLGTAASAARVLSNKPMTKTEKSASTAVSNSVMVHYINADLVGHSIYEPGKPCYKDLVHHFGSVILSRIPTAVPPGTNNSAPAGSASSGGTSNSNNDRDIKLHGHPSSKIDNSFPPLIDRRVLGDIVFADEHKLDELNAICWPYISAAIRAEHAAVCARAMAMPLPSGVDARLYPNIPPETTSPAAVALIIVEAALLCDMTDVLNLTTDLWMTHCTPVTAVDRLMQRNGLSREAAERRVASQHEVGQKLQVLRELSYKGDIEVFDTTQVSLVAGLKETEKAFERFWAKKVLVHLSQNTIA